MKKLFAVILCAVILLTAGCAAVTVETTSPLAEEPIRISSLSEEECYAFLDGHGITIPEVLRKKDMKKLLEAIEQDLYGPKYVMGYTDVSDFIEEVRAVLRTYYADTATLPPAEPVVISSLSEEECIAFLASHGVTIPEVLDRIDVLSLVERLESRLDVPLPINWTDLFDFTEAVRGVLMEHYGEGDGKVYSFTNTNGC